VWSLRKSFFWPQAHNDVIRTILGKAKHGTRVLRRACGFPYWSLAAYLKHKVKNAVKYIANFERAFAHEAQRRGLDGAICGHIHRAEISQIDGVLYCNDGDWVESCTTLTEDFAGRLSLLRWTESKEVITHSGAFAPCSLEQAA
jgi:UDP-2,3-diacylglucosamine pyrophosphatase LpxH